MANLPFRLGMGVVLLCTVIAAMSGVSGAAIVAMGLIVLQWIVVVGYEAGADKEKGASENVKG